MSVIKVNTDELNSYGADLEAKATEFTSLMKEMDEIVESVSGSWTGNDASNFISNASCYINNLKVIETAFLGFSASVKNNSSQYNNRCAEFYSRLG
jgi:uncharacterized protein YukE